MMAAATFRPAPDIDLHGIPRYRPVADRTMSLVSPALQRLYAYWLGKAAVRPPRRTDIDPLEIGPDVRHVTLLDVAHDPLRFRWRLLGGEIVAGTGRSPIGRHFEEIYPHPMLVDMMRLFSRCALTGLPIRHLGTARFAGRDYLGYESAHMPLFGDDGRVAIVFGAIHFERLQGRAND